MAPGSLPVRIAAFDNLAWVVERGTASGRERTLLFGHNGHLDRAGQATAVGGDAVGRLAPRQWGDDYRVIGTDGHRVGLNSQGTMSTRTVNGRIRGLFEGTTVGYLELASVTAADAELLRGARRWSAPASRSTGGRRGCRRCTR